METSGPPDPVVYTKVPDQLIGVLDINTFTGIGPLLKKAFVQIQEDSVEHLIIDVRTNPGGSDIGPTMDYLTDQPYRICSRFYRAPFKGYGSGEPRELECELLQPFDAAERFTGRLYLLIGPDSFSASIIFANILQDYGLATLIGEESPDSASFCASAVDSYLPRTKLLYRISVECYVRPSGVLDDNPVIPDIVVKTTIEDQIADRDPVLEYTLQLIRSGQTP
jgi:C-terminal processing protease CtpA/Prc